MKKQAAADPVRTLIDKELRERGLDMKEVSLQMGRNHAYLYQFLRKGTPRKLEEDDRVKLAELLGLDGAALKSGVAGKLHYKPAETTTPLHLAEESVSFHTVKTIDIDGDMYAAIPRYDMRASAGGGQLLPPNPEVMNRVLFRLDWIRRVTRSSLEKLAVMEVEGDSMEPTLRSGDNILIDLLQKVPSRRDGLYALNRDGELQVKRVSAHPVSGLLTITSDNSLYRSWPDIPPHEIDVVGRVIWVGRQM